MSPSDSAESGPNVGHRLDAASCVLRDRTERPSQSAFCRVCIALRADFTMPRDENGRWPFVEDENANVTGYGHQDPATFAAAVNRYDEVTNGEAYPEDEQWDAGFVGHYWVVIGQDGESLLRCTEDEPGAIPVTGLWGQR